LIAPAVDDGRIPLEVNAEELIGRLLVVLAPELSVVTPVC
jgi:hypothetical protein